MKVLYNYKQFPNAKMALYVETGNEYILDSQTGVCGWSRQEKKAVVIGEDDDCYITELKRHRICDTSDEDYGKTVFLPMGFHKSRFVKWLETPGLQLMLFQS